MVPGSAGILPSAEGCCRRNGPQYPGILADGVPDAEGPRRFLGIAVRLRFFLTASFQVRSREPFPEIGAPGVEEAQSQGGPNDCWETVPSVIALPTV